MSPRQVMPDLELPIGRRAPFYRLFEILPLLLSVTVIILPIVLSIIDPLLGTVFVIIYLIIWFVKAMAMSARSIQGFLIMRRAERVDWAVRLNDLEDPVASLQVKHDLDAWKIEVHHHNLERMAATEKPRRPSDIVNAVIIAVYNEGKDVLEETIRSVLASNYDTKHHLMLVLAYEERGGPEVERTVQALKKQYATKFLEFFLVQHPKDIPNEVLGKGANITYAGKFLGAHIMKSEIDPENIIVTTLDSDNRPHKEYFSYMTYEYIVHPEPRYVSFQPLSLYLNNIWDVPAPIRVLAMGNSFWNIIISLRPNMLRNFASHSQSLAALMDMDYWSVRTVVEDGHQFWRSYFRYDGHYSVVPIHVAIYQDAVVGKKLHKTLYAQFVQLRRWAYGVSDVPYVAQRTLTRLRTAPFWDAFPKLLRLIDSHISWASAPFVLMLGAFAPIFASSESHRSIIVHELPGIASTVQQIALIGLVVMVVLSFLLLPARPKAYTRGRTFGMLVQWVLAPFLGILYGATASIYAQSRLFSGKYLDRFDVTEKVVIKHDP